MPSWSFLHALLDLALLWPCPPELVLAHVLLPLLHWGFSPSLHLCCEVRLAVMCVPRLHDHSLFI
jgi:hypothetical protein